MKNITSRLLIHSLVAVAISSFAQQLFAQPNGYKYQLVKHAEYSKAAVSSAHPLASEAGMYVMQQGGNAVDAAIATQWALAVVYPTAGNIGGGGFLVARLSSGKNISIDYREMAPGKATENMYVDAKTGKANTRLSQSGHLASGVPGTPAGLFASLKYAKLPMKKLIQPAIDLAEKGFAITEREANRLNNLQQQLERVNTTLPVFYRERKWQAGDTLIQPDLANTLKRIRDKGQAGFYEGETADLIVNEMERGGGIISKADLKNYKAVERTPVVFTYKGYEIISMPPPSSGGVLIHQMLKMLEDRPLASYGFQTAKSVQLITEVERRAYADRAEHLGDPDYYKVPMKGLVAPAYLQQRMADYDSTKASVSSNIKSGVIKESMETTHLSVMDTDGNAVSVTTTLNGGYGSKVVVGGAGFFLNNEMDDFSVQPGVPNMFGAIGGAANAIAPGKRMLSSMTPTVVLKNNQPFMVVGTPGGTTIITSVLQSIINVVDYNMNAFDAVNKPKFHHQWQPDEVRVEKDFPMDVRKQLEAMGYKIVENGSWSATEMILVKPNGKLEVVGDKRGDDSVAGW
ncbi:gamma-glutamyltransferase [Phnomibacter sp. MR]|uniref:gamma-glutamyltransferase n=1 Tax=Phnomibacter sp. MR TaxID=3042318 RepID=UPI003A80C2C8